MPVYQPDYMSMARDELPRIEIVPITGDGSLLDIGARIGVQVGGGNVLPATWIETIALAHLAHARQENKELAQKVKRLELVVRRMKTKGGER